MNHDLERGRGHKSYHQELEQRQTCSRYAPPLVARAATLLPPLPTTTQASNAAAAPRQSLAGQHPPQAEPPDSPTEPTPDSRIRSYASALAASQLGPLLHLSPAPLVGDPLAAMPAKAHSEQPSPFRMAVQPRAFPTSVTSTVRGGLARFRQVNRRAAVDGPAAQRTAQRQGQGLRL